MAQLLSPVCTDGLKIKNPCLNTCSRGSWRMQLAKTANPWTWSLKRRGSAGRVRAATINPPSTDAVADDYYAVLGLHIYYGVSHNLGLDATIDSEATHYFHDRTDSIEPYTKRRSDRRGFTVHMAPGSWAVRFPGRQLAPLPDATPQQIKKAYYNCMKACHPDLSGNDPETTNFCTFINNVYAVLSDPIQRMIYDEIHGYALTAINPFLDDSSPKDHAFVDEFTCIGCKNCANVASDVFRIEEDFGRARVYSQCGNPDLVQQAIDSCPVNCIHWTSAAQISLLEDEMRGVERVNVALMLSGMGSGSLDVFRMASSRWEKRQAKVLEQAKARMMKQKGVDKKESYWSNLWGKPKDFQSSEEEVKEKARRAASASRRWREYSRQGVDKPPTFKLPEALSNKEK